MDDRSQLPRPSALPRPSRLPMTSSATSATPRPSSSSSTGRPPSLRPRPSRDNLAGGYGGHGGAGGGDTSAAGGELRNPKLRSVPSRGRLSLGAPQARTTKPPPALAPSSSAGSSVGLPKPASRNPTPRSRAVSGQYVAGPARPPPPSLSSGTAGRPQPLLTRRTSRQQLGPQPPFESPSDNSSADTFAAFGTIEEGSQPAAGALRPKPSRPRLSLAERTIETLSQIPSSPAKGRASAFFDPESAHMQKRPGSRSGSSTSRPGSRPGSSYQSDNSSARSPSRPPSSSSQVEPSAPNFRSSLRSAVPPSFVPISELGSTPRIPATRALRSRASIGPGVVPTSQRNIGGGLGGLRQHSESSALAPRSRTPSPEKLSVTSGLAPFSSSNRTAAASATPGRLPPKTAAGRALKPRASMSGLYQSPAKANTNPPATGLSTPLTVRKRSLASRASSTSYEELNPSSASTVSTAPSTDSAETSGQKGLGAALGSRKSSAALRDQIAKAKAAKRAMAQPQAPASDPSASGSPSSQMATTTYAAVDEAPVIPTDTTFDFGLGSDPFNQNRNDQSLTKVIQARVATARASGRLNIAALSLRQIPSEVLDMYEPDAMGTYDSSWAEAVDLTRFVAADNEIEMLEDSAFPDQSMEELAEIEDGRGNIFGGLETLDFHGNMLICLPMGLRRLSQLTSLNLSQNRITNNALEVISQIPSLRDLKLGGNLFYGPLDPCFSKLQNLEIADLHGNNISALPVTIANMSKLRILNISENNFESLVFEPLAKLPLTELHVRKNRISGVLIEDAVSNLPNLQMLDVTSNQITYLVSPTRTGTLTLPALQQLMVSMNRLQELPDLGAWPNLLTVAADENSIGSIPDGFAKLPKLRHADFSSNDIRVIPPEIGRMDNLGTLRLGGNPLRDKKFCTASTEDIKYALAARLEPEPDPEFDAGVDPEFASGQKAKAEASDASGMTARELKDELRDAVTELSSKANPHPQQRGRKLSSASSAGERDGSDDDFATPPTSVPHTPARSRSHTLSNQLWPVKPGGVLDRSETESSALHPVIASRVAQEHTVREIRLQRNMFTALPDSLSFFGETLTVLSLARNQLMGETYLGDTTMSEGLFLPALTELNLSSNYITGLGPLVRHMHAPALQKLDVSVNRVSSLPPDNQLRTAFPDLVVLLLGNNHLANLDPDSIKGLRIVDVSNNDIEHLNPRLGLLGGSGGLERLEVLGNRFRVPRFNVIERGTEATLRWLRGRIPVAEMGAWREANQRNGGLDDDVD